MMHDNRPNRADKSSQRLLTFNEQVKPNIVNDRGTNIKRPIEPTMVKSNQVPQRHAKTTTNTSVKMNNINNSGVPHGGLSFGVRLGEDLTPEEFSSFFGKS